MSHSTESALPAMSPYSAAGSLDLINVAERKATGHEKLCPRQERSETYVQTLAQDSSRSSSSPRFVDRRCEDVISKAALGKEVEEQKQGTQDAGHHKKQEVFHSGHKIKAQNTHWFKCNINIFTVS